MSFPTYVTVPLDRTIIFAWSSSSEDEVNEVYEVDGVKESDESLPLALSFTSFISFPSFTSFPHGMIQHPAFFPLVANRIAPLAFSFSNAASQKCRCRI